MLYHHHITSPLRTRINEQLYTAGDQLKDTLAELADKQRKHAMPLLTLPFEEDDLHAIESAASSITKRFKEVVILGTGGSSLNGQAMTALKTGCALRLHFVDNIDPDTLSRLFIELPLKDTAFIAISKSGNTVETLAQVLVAIEKVKEAVEESYTEHFFFVTEKGESPFRLLAETLGISVLEHPPIGGRFAGFTCVGLLPAALCGLDIRAFRRGAKEVLLAHLSDVSAMEVLPPAAEGALLALYSALHHHPIHVCMPYIDKLTTFSLWYRQMWAESLGKSGKGFTPVNALGTVDQHSQLQLYLDGPSDKVFTFLVMDRKKEGDKVPTGYLSNGPLAYLEGKTFGDIITAEQHATIETLIKHGKMVRQFILSELNEAVLGALMMHFMLETVLTASLLAINPFDQPAVEESKQLTRMLLQEYSYV